MDNYRPISILSAISKVAEKAMFHQLYSYLKEENLLSPFQSGFREGFSTETAVTFFVDIIFAKIWTVGCLLVRFI